VVGEHVVDALDRLAGERAVVVADQPVLGGHRLDVVDGRRALPRGHFEALSSADLSAITTQPVADVSASRQLGA